MEDDFSSGFPTGSNTNHAVQLPKLCQFSIKSYVVAIYMNMYTRIVPIMAQIMQHMI